MQHETLITEDGISLAALYWPPPKNGSAALLLHMMPAKKESWIPFAELLQAEGMGALAIDFRGHGESVSKVEGGTLDYRTFGDAEHMLTSLDVETALAWLAERDVPASRTALVGASIGANLAIRAAAAHPEVPAVVALSPGLNYHGVTTEDAAVKIPRACSVLLASSEDDGESFEAVRELSRLMSQAECRWFRAAGHGTAMFQKEPTLPAQLASWLRRNVR